MAGRTESPYYSNPAMDYTVYTGSPSTQRRNGGPNTMMPPPVKPKTANARNHQNANPYSTGFAGTFDDTGKETPGKNTGSPERGFRHLVSVYADKCSLNGIIFIKSSKYMMVKAIWTLLLLGATGMMFYHLYRLGKNYYSYEKQSKIDLKFANLKFPAVTVCNVNAIRDSKKHMASERLRNLIESVDPTKMAESVSDWEPEYEDDYVHYDEFGNIIDENDYSGSGSGDGSRRRKRSTTGTTSTSSSTTSKRRKRRRKASNTTVRQRTSNFFDDYNFTDYDDTDFEDYSGSTYVDSWESESEPASFDKMAKQFTNLYSIENGTVRQSMGHQIQDMLIQCSFAGRKCVQKNFTLVATATLGNCYTIEYNKFLTRQSGPRKGLSLMLYLESEEYIPGITNTKGAQVVIHEPGTLPFPDDEGLTASAGKETTVGLRRISISRLDQPYGECSNVKDFITKYGIKYTRQTCQEICEMEEVHAACNCYDSTKPVIYSLLGKHTKLKNCQNKRDDVECMEGVKWDFQNKAVSCSCDSPCTEIQYRKTVSSRVWPSQGFANLITDTICKESPGSKICEGTVRNDRITLRENFVKVTIFFESLNYESLSEEPDYTEFQFISDIGGTVGLYIGLSVLSMCEILHLLISVVRYFYYGNWRKD